MQNSEYQPGLQRRALAIVVSLVYVWTPIYGSAADVVEIESKWIDAGSKNVTLGIALQNTTPLVAMRLPLNVRSIHWGSFFRRSLDVRPSGRMSGSGRTWPLLSTTISFPGLSNAYYRIDFPGDSLSLRSRFTAVHSKADSLGEEALVYCAAEFRWDPPSLPSGEDADNNPSLVLEFDVTDQGGAFVVDTAFTSWPYQFAFVEENKRAITPEYRAGIVLVGCNAECHSDPICDGECNIIDLVRTVDIAFNGAPPAIDPDPRCPVENTDVNCDMTTNVLDIVRMINVQYRSMSQASQFCVPCDHIPRTGNPRDDVKTPYFRNNGTY